MRKYVIAFALFLTGNTGGTKPTCFFSEKCKIIQGKDIQHKQASAKGSASFNQWVEVTRFKL